MVNFTELAASLMSSNVGVVLKVNFTVTSVEITSMFLCFMCCCCADIGRVEGAY